MKNLFWTRTAWFLLFVLQSAAAGAADDKREFFEKSVAQTIRPLMEQYQIPGMAVGVIVNNESYVYNYGSASKAAKLPVTDNTLFEIGSISKAFTAILASYAQVTGRLSLSDNASKYLPSLRGSDFDKVSLLNLGTHTSGGLPLQFPDNVKDNVQVMRYFQEWQPVYAPGEYRAYANPGIGMLGMIAAKSLAGEFTALMKNIVFAGLRMKSTVYEVPKLQAGNYALGYTQADAPVRLTPGVLASEAYGIRSTAGDMVRFMKANMLMLELDKKLQSAIANTRSGYYQVGVMTQGLVWEQYRYPVTLEDLLEGNSAKVSLEANPATKIDPPKPPLVSVLVNKTGSTSGFSSYVAFIPKMKTGIVLLANKNYPVEARVMAGYQILTKITPAMQ